MGDEGCGVRSVWTLRARPQRQSSAPADRSPWDDITSIEIVAAASAKQARALVVLPDAQQIEDRKQNR